MYMLNPHLVLNISHTREHELARAAEQARVRNLGALHSRRAPQRASEPAPHTSREAQAGAGCLATGHLR
jgi:hypothetical protein